MNGDSVLRVGWIMEMETGTMEESGPRELAAQLEVLPEDLFVVSRMRRLLSAEMKHCAHEIAMSGAVPGIARLVSPSNPNARLVLEAACVLTSVISGNSGDTATAIAAGAIGAFTELLVAYDSPVPMKKSATYHAVEQATWSLGSIAYDGAATRDAVIAAGAVAPLVSIVELNLEIPNRASLIRNAAWALSGFVRHKPCPDWNQVKAVLPVFLHIAKLRADKETVCSALWGMSFCTSNVLSFSPDEVSSTLDSCLPYLSEEDADFVTPALRAVGNVIATDEAPLVSLALDKGLLDRLESCLCHPNRKVSKEALWVLSNVTAGTTAQIQAVLDRRELMHHVVALADCADGEVKKEACWVVVNGFAAATPEQSRQFVDFLCARVMCTVLSFPDTRILRVAVTGIGVVLSGLKSLGAAERGMAMAKVRAAGLEACLREHVDLGAEIPSILSEFFPEAWE